jgi:DNA-directed RNA polymerase specialized sigma24 family protein
MERELDEVHERQLVESARCQPEAFRELYRHYFTRVFAYVASHTSRLPDAEDLVSSTFLRVVTGISGLYPSSS